MAHKITDPAFRMKFGSQLPGGEEAISWIWFDTVTYTSASTRLLTFFNAVRTDKTLGNMEVAGQLAAPKYFVIYAIRIVPKVPPSNERLTAVGAYAVSPAEDIYRLLFNSRCRLVIGSKEYLNHPSSVFTSGQGLHGFTSADGASGATTVYEAHRIMYATNGMPDPRCVYVLPTPRLIEPQINFFFEMEWNAAETLSANRDIRVELDGILYRPIQ